MAEIDMTTQHEVEQLLYYEARLLDGCRFHEWLDLFTDDVRYEMPVLETVQGKPADAEDQSMSYGLYDENKASLLLRIRRLDTGVAHVEVPPSVTQHLITGIEVKPTDLDGEVVSYSSFIVFQLRHEEHQSFFVGSREDRLRKLDGTWKICRRKILLKQQVLPRVVSIFF